MTDVNPLIAKAFAEGLGRDQVEILNVQCLDAHLLVMPLSITNKLRIFQASIRHSDAVYIKVHLLLSYLENP
jgi:hypothetical protein